MWYVQHVFSDLYDWWHSLSAICKGHGSRYIHARIEKGAIHLMRAVWHTLNITIMIDVPATIRSSYGPL